jgi:hypothetical protein
MYSAVIPGNTDHTFQIPAIVAGVNSNAVHWSASSNAVMLSADPSTGGVLITMNPAVTASQVTIQASAGGSCGTSVLNITSSTVGAWDAGAARYNDGVPIPANPRQVFEPDAGPGSLRIACVNCHAPKGEDAGMGFGFNDVAHTPEQTGGFSDQQLLDIVQNGVVPGYDDAGVAAGDAGYFDPTIVSYTQWHRFHQWNLTTAEQGSSPTCARSRRPTRGARPTSEASAAGTCTPTAASPTAASTTTAGAAPAPARAAAQPRLRPRREPTRARSDSR